MTVGIPPEFVCPQGHRWRLDDHPADRSDDERLRCLICGADALPADRPIGEGGGEGPSGQPPRHSLNPPPGTTTFPAIPGYAILGVLGRGRAGVVYEARELAWDRRVTLEVIESERNGASGDIGLVHLDAGAMRLHHPNIVPVLACGRHDGAEFLVSEFEEGENLRGSLWGQTDLGSLWGQTDLGSLWGQTDLEFSPLRPRARSSAMRSRLAFDSLWSRAANRADRLGTLSGRERPRIGTSSARVASVWCFAR